MNKVGDQAESEPLQLRLCSYNIHKGVCAANSRAILPQLRHSIRTVNADMMFLQEVVGEKQLADLRINDSRGSAVEYPQFEFLADEVWPHYAYGRNAIYQTGHHGNAILSKYPFDEWDNTDVSQWRFSQRGILLGKLKIGVYVICTHFGLLARERKRQLVHLLDLISQRIPDTAPLIIAGDFNDWSGSLDREIRRRAQVKDVYKEVYGRRAKTFPAKFPVFAMDRIYYRNINLMDAEVLSGMPWQQLSDHCALYAEFSIPC
ncbi:MAG: endonuclease/exonuclease/phosphatase family protein [Oceanicoccus sp.]